MYVAAKDSWEKNESACASEVKVLIYREVFELTALDNRGGLVTYKVGYSRFLTFSWFTIYYL